MKVVTAALLPPVIVAIGLGLSYVASFFPFATLIIYIVGIWVFVSWLFYQLIE